MFESEYIKSQKESSARVINYTINRLAINNLGKNTAQTSWQD